MASEAYKEELNQYNPFPQNEAANSGANALPKIKGMSKTSELYMYNDTRLDINGTQIDEGRPLWFKLWVEKYATSLDIENLDKDLTQKDKELLFKEVGKAFINALFYFMGHDAGVWEEYKPRTRDGRILWNALKKDIDQSYIDYEKRVADGRKGGRPKKNEDDTK